MSIKSPPNPPSMDEIHQDLRGAPDNDPIFTFDLKQLKQVTNSFETNFPSKPIQIDSVDSSDFQLYDKVKTFVEENNEMLQSVERLTERTELLKNTALEMKQCMICVQDEELTRNK